MLPAVAGDVGHPNCFDVRAYPVINIRIRPDHFKELFGAGLAWQAGAPNRSTADFRPDGLVHGFRD
ncbi:MAG: hypothetical protein DMG13_25865 [Acidobacteria bacterium]|nr:MAG: hypothetical protein DMG13_25865 [Acidobacteriota bacterium]